MSGHWESGWDVFVNISDPINVFNDNGDDTLCEQGEDCLLRTFDPLLSGYQLTAHNNSSADYAAYLPSGIIDSTPGLSQFTLCNKPGQAVSKRTININSIGRPSVDPKDGTCP